MRFLTLIRVDLLTQWRYGIIAVLCGLSLCWTVLLTTMDVHAVGPYLLFVETITGATMVAGALAAMDATSGATAAVRVSPARPVEVVGARLITLTSVTAVSALPVLLASDVITRLPVTLTATILAALLFLGLAVTIGARQTSFLGFVTTAPWPLLPLLAVPLLVASGLLDGWYWYAIPTTGVLALLRADAPYPAWLLLSYLGICAVAMVWFAVRLSGKPARPDLATARIGPPLTGRWVRPRADLRGIARDAMLTPIVASPILLGLALRFGYPPLESWLDRTHGVDLASYRPIIALVAVVVHVPTIFGMVGALLVLDARDEGALRVIRVSPLGLDRHLVERVSAVGVATALGLTISAPLSGLIPATAWPAIVLAIPLGPLFFLAILAVASSRVQGLTAAKALGVPAYLPAFAIWLPGGWLLAPLPSFWIARAWNGPHADWLIGGALCATVWLYALFSRVRTRL